MPAYSDSYLMEAMENLGEMADVVSHIYGIELCDFWPLFAATDLAREFESGSPRVVVVLSGTELALRSVEVLVLESACTVLPPAFQTTQEAHTYGLSPEYWCGWILAYYQWSSERSFANISQFLTIDNLLRMYPTFHEMSEEHFLEAADEMAVRTHASTRLKRQRELVGYSQSELARKSGVSLRAIQQYEQRAKDINHASIERVKALAKVLYCTPQALLEYDSKFEYALVTLS